LMITHVAAFYFLLRPQSSEEPKHRAVEILKKEIQI
jgi:hypothetical protein